MGWTGVRRSVLTIVVAGLALAGCSATVPGEAVPAEIALDTGNFATVPREVPVRVGDDAAVQGNIALGDYVVMPSDLDAAFDWGLYRLFPSLPDANSMMRVMGTGLGTALQPGRVSGVLAPAREDPNSDDAAQATLIVLRYSAEFYARAAFDSVVAIPPTVGGAAPAKYPSAHVGAQPESFRSGPAIWLRHKEYILAATFANIADQERVRSLTSAFFDRQIPKLDAVPFTPQQALLQPVDKDGILSLTRVDSTEAGTVNYGSGYYSARTYAMNGTGSKSRALSIYAVHGIDLIGNEGRNQILRAANPSRAADFVKQAGIAAGTDSVQGFRVENDVPGLRDTTCHSRVVSLYGRPERVFACYVSRGRYVGAAQGPSLKQAQQGAAASYVVLKAAK